MLFLPSDSIFIFLRPGKLIIRSISLLESDNISQEAKEFKESSILSIGGIWQSSLISLLSEAFVPVLISQALIASLQLVVLALIY